MRSDGGHSSPAVALVGAWLHHLGESGRYCWRMTRGRSGAAARNGLLGRKSMPKRRTLALASSLALTLLAVGSLAACAQSQSESSPATAAPRDHGATGLIYGRLYMSGGPVGPLQPRPGPSPANHREVAIRSGERTVARATTNKAGVFRIHVQPGSYLVSAVEPGTCPARQVVVKAGRTVPVALVCNFR